MFLYFFSLIFFAIPLTLTPVGLVRLCTLSVDVLNKYIINIVVGRTSPKLVSVLILRTCGHVTMASGN